jgi:hypothetical protein
MKPTIHISEPFRDFFGDDTNSIAARLVERTFKGANSASVYTIVHPTTLEIVRTQVLYDGKSGAFDVRLYNEDDYLQ